MSNGHKGHQPPHSTDPQSDTASGKGKYPGPFLNGPTLSNGDIAYVSYRLAAYGLDVNQSHIAKPPATPQQINAVFVSGYQSSQFTTVYPNYARTPSADVKAACDAWLKWKSGK